MFKFYLHKLKTDDVTRELCLLLMIGGLYSLGIFLSNTFVNVYLWRQSNDFNTIAIYNLAIIIFQVITFVISGRIAKKIDRVMILRLGVIFLAVFFITVLIVGENAAFYNFLLGALLGVGYGFYWLAFNVLAFEITEPDTRDVFNGVMGGLESFGGMVGPLLAGFIIARLATNSGYMVVFSISLSFFLLAIGCSFFLKGRKAEGKYNLIATFREIKKNKQWRSILLANIFQGLREGIFMFLITILLFITTQNEFTLGMFNFALCGLSLLFYLIVTKMLKNEWRIKAIFIGALIISLSVFIIAFNQSLNSFIIYAVTVGIAYPVIKVPFNSLTYDVIGQSKSIHTLRIEYIVVLELFVNIGRLISILTFIIGLYYYDSINFIIVLLVIYSHAYIFIYIFVSNMYRNTSNKNSY